MIVFLITVIIFVIYLIICKIYDAFWDYNLTAEVSLPKDNAFESEVVDLKEIIVNDKLLFLPVLEVDFNFSKGLSFQNEDNSSVSDKVYRRDVFYVGIKKKITRTLPIVCDKRGYYTITGLGMMSRDVFMMHTYLGKRKFFEDFFVYPKKVSSERVNIPYNKIMGEYLSRQKMYDDPFSFAGIRSYTISDPMKLINWKASAKSDELLVNMYDSCIKKNITLIIDTYENRSVEHEQLNEECIRIASALCDRFIAQRIDVSLIANARDMFTNKILDIRNLSNLGIEEVRKSFSRLILGEEAEIVNFFSSINPESLVVLISKNDKLLDRLSQIENDMVWILPYKHDKPEIDAGKYNTVYWQYLTKNMN